jgi:hypothetical protein
VPRTKVNKSEAVRQYLSNNPSASAKEVVDSLKSKGIKITAQLVYSLRGKAKPGKKAGKRATRTAATSNGMQNFLAVLDLARQIGVKNLREIASRLPE